MPNKKYKAEQIVTLLRQIEVGIANGKTTPQVCKEAEITVLEMVGSNGLEPLTWPSYDGPLWSFVEPT
jgi:hypothetical protein